MLFGEAKEEVGSGSAGDTMVEANDLEKTYAAGGATVHALRGVDLSIPRSEMVAIMGPSGCGKTTLLNCLSGLDEFDSGEVYVGGESISGMSDRRRTRFRAEQMGFIFQTYNLIPVLSAVENVELPLLVAGVRSKEARGRALSVLRAVGLADQVNKRPNEMSGGQQQRVTVARSLVNEPAIVWADEPTGALDSTTATEIIDLMRQLNRSQRLTLVIVTHDPGVGARCDRIVQMRDGEVVGEDRPRQAAPLDATPVSAVTAADLRRPTTE